MSALFHFFLVSLDIASTLQIRDRLLTCLACRHAKGFGIVLMKLFTPASAVCVLSLILGGCQSVSVSEIQTRLDSLDFNLDSASYVVRAGETLESIAFRYNTTVPVLQQLNPDAVNGLYTGMYLTIRQPGGSPAPAIRNAALSSIDTGVEEQVVNVTPAQNLQALPITTTATDQYLLGGQDRFNRNTPDRDIVIPDTGIVTERSTGYVEQPGYPVEEVIDDENFVLPPAPGAVDVPLEQFASEWQWPLQGKLARDYDPQRINGRGIEIVGLPGQEVRAARNGVVNWVARSPDGVGKVVIVRHDDDYLSIYSNAQDLFVSMNDTVRQGDPIASLGANANDEPLLRFEISRDGKLLNPMDFLVE